MPLLRILHVEDDPDDAFFFRRSVKSAKLDWDLNRVHNGEGAIAFLRQTISANGSSSPSNPDLVLLDLKLPGLSGFDVLSWMRAQADLKTVPVIVLSGSSLVQDKDRALALGANEFIVKHSDYDAIVSLLTQFIATIGLLSNSLMSKD